MQKDFPVQVSTRSPVVELVPPLGEQVSEGSQQGDLWVLVSVRPPAADVGVPVDPGRLGSSTSSGLGAPANLGQPLEDESVQLPESLPGGDVVPQRSRRATAGQHSDVHHLLWSAGVVGNDGVLSEGTSMTILAWFRPWT